MSTEQLPDDFVRRLTDVQDRLYAYILAVLPDREAAREVLQETNIVMCRKFSSLKPGQDFNAWACQVALYEVRTYRRNLGRDKHVFNDELLELVAEDSEQHNAIPSSRGAFLENCLEKLAPSQREMIRWRYNPGGSSQDIAEKTGRSASSVGVALFRIRKTLLECIRRSLEQEKHA